MIPKTRAETYRGTVIRVAVFSSREHEAAEDFAARMGMAIMLGSHDGDEGELIVAAREHVEALLTLGYDVP